jgi:hypothetical protein
MWITSEGLDAVAAVRLHNVRVVIHGEVDRDARMRDRLQRDGNTLLPLDGLPNALE